MGRSVGTEDKAQCFNLFHAHLPRVGRLTTRAIQLALGVQLWITNNHPVAIIVARQDNKWKVVVSAEEKRKQGRRWSRRLGGEKVSSQSIQQAPDSTAFVLRRPMMCVPTGKGKISPASADQQQLPRKQVTQQPLKEPCWWSFRAHGNTLLFLSSPSPLIDAGITLRLHPRIRWGVKRNGESHPGGHE